MQYGSLDALLRLLSVVYVCRVCIFYCSRTCRGLWDLGLNYRQSRFVLHIYHHFFIFFFHDCVVPESTRLSLSPNNASGARDQGCRRQFDVRPIASGFDAIGAGSSSSARGRHQSHTRLANGRASGLRGHAASQSKPLCLFAIDWCVEMKFVLIVRWLFYRWKHNAILKRAQSVQLNSAACGDCSIVGRTF
jgi:hypothetical protein